jgi:hypothetical protein
VATTVFTDLATAQGAPVFWPFRWVVMVSMLVLVTLGWAVAGVATHRFGWIDRAHAPGDQADDAVRAPRRASLAAGLFLVAGVAAPVALATWHGSVGRQPAQEASTPLLRLEPIVVADARQHDVVVANTVNKLNDKDLALPVILERAGIDWIERDDPDAVGRMGYFVVPAGALNDPLVASALFVGEAEVVGRSGPPRPGEAPNSELMVLRAVTKEFIPLDEIAEALGVPPAP